jgi:hypothetical protein
VFAVWPGVELVVLTSWLVLQTMSNRALTLCGSQIRRFLRRMLSTLSEPVYQRSSISQVARYLWVQSPKTL